jgi:hypothetical protein
MASDKTRMGTLRKKAISARRKAAVGGAKQHRIRRLKSGKYVVRTYYHGKLLNTSKPLDTTARELGALLRREDPGTRMFGNDET